MKRISLTLLTLVLISCSDNKEQKAEKSPETVHANATDTIVSGGEPVVLEGCYRMAVQRDTATMYLNIMGTEVTGKLVYNYYEKDDNTGSLKGELRDDRIYANYIFQAEGGTSAREVVFKIRDTVLLEGHGPVAERNGKMIFLHADQLQFDPAHPFVKVDCRPEDR